MRIYNGTEGSITTVRQEKAILNFFNQDTGDIVKMNTIMI